MSGTGKPWRPPWSKARQPPKKRVADMAPDEHAAHLAILARRAKAKEAAIAAMTPEQRAAFDERETKKREKKAANADARTQKRAEARARAVAMLDAHVEAMHAPGDLPFSERETAQKQSEDTMCGILLAEFARPNNGRALVMLREWNGELRLLFTLAFVENGRAVRSRGWTLYLREVTAGGEVTLSTRELRALHEAIGFLVARLESGDPALAADVGRLRDARERRTQARARGAADDGGKEASP